MKRQLIIGSAVLLIAGMFLTTCNKEYFELDKLSDEIELEPQLVAPLLYGSMSLDDIIEVVDSLGYTEVDDEGLIYIVYSDTAFAISADTVVDVPDKVVTEYYIDSDIDIPVWLGSAVGDTVPFFKRESFSFELDGNDRVDSVQIKGGQIVIDVMSSFEHTGLLTISSAEILDVNRDTFSTVVNISDMSGNFTFQDIFPTDGYNLVSVVENDSNFIHVNFRLDLINSGNVINPDDECIIDASFENMDFYSVFGYIDSRDLLTESGEFEISFFENNPDLANIQFADPRINIFAANSVGIPLEVELDNVISTSSVDGSTVELTFNDGNLFVFNAPTLEQLGQTIDTEININNTTSNIDDLLNSAPSSITYDITGRTEAGNPAAQHFVLDTSQIELALEFVLPLDFKSTGFAFRDTLEFEVGEEGIDTSIIKLAQVSLETVNELPIQLEVQVYLLDVNEVIIDSIFDETAVLLEAASVDGEGKLQEAMEEINSITFPAEKLAKLEDVTSMWIEARLLTSDNGVPFVKLYTDYTLDFELSMFANFRINTREL